MSKLKVAQLLVQWSLPKPDIGSSNPDNWKVSKSSPFILSTLLCNERVKKQE